VFNEDARGQADIITPGQDVTITVWLDYPSAPTTGIVTGTFSGTFGGGAYALLLNYSGPTQFLGFNTWNGDLFGCEVPLDGQPHKATAFFKHGDITQCRLWVDDVEQVLSQKLGTPHPTQTVKARFGVGANVYGAAAPWMYTGRLCRVKTEQGSTVHDYFFSQGYLNLVRDENGGANLVMSGLTYATFWQKFDDVYPRNFRHGFKLFTNGVEAENYYTPYDADTATVLSELPPGYEFDSATPPLVFGPMESWFSVPDEPEIEAAAPSLFSGGVPKKLTNYNLLNDTFDLTVEFDVNGGVVQYFTVKKP